MRACYLLCQFNNVFMFGVYFNVYILWCNKLNWISYVNGILNMTELWSGQVISSGWLLYICDQHPKALQTDGLRSRLVVSMQLC